MDFDVYVVETLALMENLWNVHSRASTLWVKQLWGKCHHFHKAVQYSFDYYKNAVLEVVDN